MKDTVYDILMIIGGTIFAALLIIFVMGKVNAAKDTSSKADEVVNAMTDSLVNDKYTQYDGAVVKGSTVLSFIQSSKSDVICIQVKNGSTTTEYVRKLSDLSQSADGKIADAKNKANVTTTYIDPSVDYLGEVLYMNDDPTQTIIGVSFERQ